MMTMSGQPNYYSYLFAQDDYFIGNQWSEKTSEVFYLNDARIRHFFEEQRASDLE